MVSEEIADSLIPPLIEAVTMRPDSLGAAAAAVLLPLAHALPPKGSGRAGREQLLPLLPLLR